MIIPKIFLAGTALVTGVVRGEDVVDDGAGCDMR